MSNSKIQINLIFVQVGGCLYFLFYLAFGFFFFEERFMIDGAYMIFEMVNTKSIPSAQNRLIIYLLDIFPVIAANLGLSLKAVMASWLVNYTLFYFLCFYLVAFRFKDSKNAWFILAINIFTMQSCYFNMANEIIPTATLLIVLISMLSGNFKIPYRNLILGFLLFFIVFGHLMTPLAFCFLIAYWIGDGALKPKSIKSEHKKLFVLGAVLLVLRLLLGFNDSYEQSRMGLSAEVIKQNLSHIDVNYLIDFVSFYLNSFRVISVLILFVIIHSVLTSNYKKILWICFLSSCYMLLWFAYLEPKTGGALSVYDSLAIRWLFPLNFLWLYLFLHVIFNEFNSNKYNYQFRFVMVFLISYQFYFLYQISDFAQQTINQYEVMFSIADETESSKMYIERNDYSPHTYYHGVYTNSIVFSAIRGKEKVVQIIPAESHELKPISKLDTSDLYLTKQVVLKYNMLNEDYFVFEDGRYEELDYNWEDYAEKIMVRENY